MNFGLVGDYDMMCGHRRAGRATSSDALAELADAAGVTLSGPPEPTLPAQRRERRHVATAADAPPDELNDWQPSLACCSM